jgi:hypothetical protein
MTTDNPQSVVVNAEIDFHTAINAVGEFAAKYPVERLAHYQADILRDAADLINERIAAAWRISQLLAK